MKNTTTKNRAAHVTIGSAFDDLGLDPGEVLEAKIKSEIWRAIIQESETRGFSQAILAQKLKVHQPDVSNLLNGKISRFSVSKLIQFAARLNLRANLQVTARAAGDQKVRPSAAKAS